MVNKEKQLELILKTNPMWDDYHVGIRKVEDILTYSEAVLSEPPTYPDWDEAKAHQAIAKGKITIYSSKQIKPGTFVTPSKIQANEYAGGQYTEKNGQFIMLGNKRIYSETCPLEYVAWINGDEGVYCGESCVDEANERVMSNVGACVEAILNGKPVRKAIDEMNYGTDCLEIEVKPGDQIEAMGERVTISEILFADVVWCYDAPNRCMADIEFKDENGNYRHWQSWSDGGKLILAKPFEGEREYQFIKESRTPKTKME